MGEEEQLNGAGGRHVGRVHSWRKGRAKKTVGVPAGRAEFCIVFREFCNVVPFPASDRRRCQSPDSRVKLSVGGRWGPPSSIPN